MRFLIVQTGSTLPPLRARRGDFPQWIRHGLGLPRSAVDIVRVETGGSLPADPRGHAAVIVTGSPAMVSERQAWSEATALWLRGAVDAGVPMLGICYGHQLLAHALGGHVDDHPQGRELGTVTIERLAASADDALLGACPARFRAHASHRQSVLDLPAGAVALARSAHDPHQAVRYAPAVWGVQFHPEFSVEIMRGYVSARTRAGDGEDRSAYPSRGGAAPAPVAARLLRRFRVVATRAARPG